MTKTVKGAGRGRYAANKARHDQKTPLPARGSEPVHDAHTEALRAAAGAKFAMCPRCRKKVEVVRDWLADHENVPGEELCPGSGVA